jgi:hypothetical protein
MKQASFQIGVKKPDKLSSVFSNNEIINDLNNDLNNETTNITSNKPIKLVENIYYFTCSKPNSINI